MVSKYDEIIELPHHVSANRRPMSMYDRAAQFAPFAALNGHDEAIAETARLTTELIELSADEQKALSRQLRHAHENSLEVSITHFCPDPYKDGGKYVATWGVIKKMDETSGSLIMRDGTEILFGHIYAVRLSPIAD